MDNTVEKPKGVPGRKKGTTKQNEKSNCCFHNHGVFVYKEELRENHTFLKGNIFVD